MGNQPEDFDCDYHNKKRTLDNMFANPFEICKPSSEFANPLSQNANLDF
jgi:hypothetical protein